MRAIWNRWRGCELVCDRAIVRTNIKRQLGFKEWVVEED